MDLYTEEDKIFEECRERVKKNYTFQNKRNKFGDWTSLLKNGAYIRRQSVGNYLNSPAGKEKINQCVRRILEKAIQPHIMPQFPEPFRRKLNKGRANMSRPYEQYAVGRRCSKSRKREILLGLC